MIGYVAGTRGRDSSDRRPIQRVNASTFLHLWIGIGVANHVVRAGSQSRLRLVLRALQTSRNLFGAACSRDLLASGRRTASGQTFDPGGHTAAHRTLPFGSRVTVTNPQNGRSVTVVINDRGPFTRGVTLDLTRSAARAIGMYRTQWVCML
jgi:rare lipoprotein A (peptidoglycan hydrolase)